MPVLCSVLVCGCATYRNELVFADTTDIGVSIHPATTSGAQFVVGYKQRDLAVIPVGGLDARGQLLQRRTHAGDGSKDAISVFGQFASSSANASGKQAIGLGRFFATGVASVNLAEGYRQKWAGQDAQAAGGQAGAPARPAASSSQDEPESGPAAAAGVEAGTGTARPAADAGAARATVLLPLVFGQVATFGLDGTTAADVIGSNFTLGYSGQDIAIMPVFTEVGGGTFRAMGGKAATSDQDAYSVLGQFKADTAANSLNLELGRFFSTGLAAQRLSLGLQAQISAKGQAGSATLPAATAQK